MKSFPGVSGHNGVPDVYPTRPDLPILVRSTLRTLSPRKEETLAAAKKRIDRALSESD
jgi:hypothetical protein